MHEFQHEYEVSYTVDQKTQTTGMIEHGQELHVDIPDKLLNKHVTGELYIFIGYC